DSVGHPSHVRELEVQRIGEVDVRLRDSVDEQRPTGQRAWIRDQFGGPEINGHCDRLTPVGGCHDRERTAGSPSLVVRPAARPISSRRRRGGTGSASVGWRGDLDAAPSSRVVYWTGGTCWPVIIGAPGWAGTAGAGRPPMNWSSSVRQ